MTARGAGYREMQEPDMLRRLSKMIQYGTVAETKYDDPKAPRVKVKIGEKLTTGWLPFSQARSGDDSSWDPLDVGEQVMIAAPSGDMAQAMVIASTPKGDMPAPGTSPDQVIRKSKDGSVETHDRKTKTRTLQMPDDGKLVIVVGATRLELSNAGATLTTKKFVVDSPETEFTGTVLVRKLLSYLAGLVGKNGGGAVAELTGDINHTSGELNSNGIIVHKHRHSNTGAPTGNA